MVSGRELVVVGYEHIKDDQESASINKSSILSIILEHRHQGRNYIQQILI